MIVPEIGIEVPDDFHKNTVKQVYAGKINLVPRHFRRLVRAAKLLEAGEDEGWFAVWERHSSGAHKYDRRKVMKDAHIDFTILLLYRFFNTKIIDNVRFVRITQEAYIQYYKSVQKVAEQEDFKDYQPKE